MRLAITMAAIAYIGSGGALFEPIVFILSVAALMLAIGGDIKEFLRK